MYCHLKAAQCDAIANLRCYLDPRDTSDLISMVSFTFTIWCHLIWLTSAPFTSFPLAKFVWVPFAICNAWQQSRTESFRRVGENSSPILTHLWTKVHKISRQCRRPPYFPMSWHNYLCHVSFTRYSILSLKVVEKPNKCKSFCGSLVFGRDDPDFSMAGC